jgi:hypothetical protein
MAHCVVCDEVDLRLSVLGCQSRQAVAMKLI